MTWRERAECRDAAPEIFFAGYGTGRGGVSDRWSSQRRTAMRICGRCEVIETCRAYALSMGVNSDFGIWGGTTTAQRHEIRRQTPTAPREALTGLVGSG